MDTDWKTILIATIKDEITKCAILLRMSHTDGSTEYFRDIDWRNRVYENLMKNVDKYSLRKRQKRTYYV